MRPASPSRGAQPRNRLLIAVLVLALLAFLITLPWQVRNWREAAVIRRDASRQQARLQQLQQAHGDLRRAQDALRAAPNDPNAQLALAAQLAQNRDFPGAAAHLRALEPAAMRSPDLAGAAAELYQKIGDIDRAVALARQALRLAPDSPQAGLRLGILDMQIGWQAPGLALLHRAARALPGSAEPHLALALAANQSGAYKDAERELVRADRLRPGDWHIAALLADNRAAQGRDADGLQSVADALRLAPQEASLYAQQAHIRLDQARMQGAGKQPDIAPAVQAARQCLALDPYNAEAHDTLGRAYRDTGLGADARREWEQALALAPGDPTLGYNLARLRIEQGDRAAGLQLLAEAARAAQDKAAYDRLVALAGDTPSDPDRHRQLARWCQTHHHLSRAIFEWQEVLAHLPQDAEARQNMAQLIARRG
jgi:Flp pilus assembly protein TadD